MATKIKKTIELIIFFILLMGVMIGSDYLITMIYEAGFKIGTGALLVISEAIILIPAAIYAVIRKLDIHKDLGINPIKISTVLLTVLLSILVTPIATFFNLLSQLWVPNTMVQATDSLLSVGFIPLILLAGIYGPICEEFAFRSVLCNGLSRATGIIAGSIISGLMFGIMHMNLNQFCYAVALGIIFGIVNKASGSVLTSVIIHIAINTSNIIMLIASSAILSSTGIDYAESAELTRTPSLLIPMIAVYGIFAVCGGVLSALVIKKIAAIEGTHSA